MTHADRLDSMATTLRFSSDHAAALREGASALREVAFNAPFLAQLRELFGTGPDAHMGDVATVAAAKYREALREVAELRAALAQADANCAALAESNENNGNEADRLAAENAALRARMEDARVLAKDTCLCKGQCDVCDAARRILANPAPADEKIGNCESCGAPLHEGDDVQRWADEVLTHRGDCPAPAQPTCPECGSDDNRKEPCEECGRGIDR